jgi:quinol monooxygenase YgiN
VYKFIITIDLLPGMRDQVLAQAPTAQAATRAEAGCIAYDFYTCTDNPDRLVFVEVWQDEAAHAFHMTQDHTKRFIAFHEQFHRRLVFETVNIASGEKV